jgi:low affinity Fe/Cu permease
MNTTSSIITFCMVFVIQASQNRDSKAIQLKLDEIIRSTSGARNELIDLEVAPEERVNETEQELMRVAAGEADEASSRDPASRPPASQERGSQERGSQDPPVAPEPQDTTAGRPPR